MTSSFNLPTDTNEIVSARSEKLQVYSFNNGDGGYDQMIMKPPKKLKCDVSNKFPYQFLGKKRQNKNKFESNYDTKPQTAIGGAKYTITTDTNKGIPQKIFSNPLPNSFQNPFFRRGKTGGNPTESSNESHCHQQKKTPKKNQEK